MTTTVAEHAPWWVRLCVGVALLGFSIIGLGLISWPFTEWHSDFPEACVVTGASICAFGLGALLLLGIASVTF